MGDIDVFGREYMVDLWTIILRKGKQKSAHSSFPIGLRLLCWRI